jgi:hypothetical protein
MEAGNKADTKVREMKAEFSDWEEAALSDINAWIEKSGKRGMKRKR